MSENTISRAFGPDVRNMLQKWASILNSNDYEGMTFDADERALDDRETAWLLLTADERIAELEKHNHYLQVANTEEVERRRKAEAAIRRALSLLPVGTEEASTIEMEIEAAGYLRDALAQPTHQGAADYRERVLRRFGEEEAD